MHSSATLALRVSMLKIILSFANSTIGRSFFNCSSSFTGLECGLVDSAPISIISAPSSIIRKRCSFAFSKSLYKPPSEKESGVTFKIPTIFGVIIPPESETYSAS